MDISKNQWRSTGGKGELGQALVPTPTLETNKQANKQANKQDLQYIYRISSYSFRP